MINLFPRVILVFAAAYIGGCATDPSRVNAPTTAPAVVAKPVKDDLPKLDLDPGVMYDVLAGEIAMQRGQVTAAAKALARAAQQTRDPRLAERATLAAFNARQYDEALRVAQLWVTLRPKDVEAREALAAVLVELGRHGEAQVELEQLLVLEEARGHLDQGYLRAATILGRHGNRVAATELMQALVRHHPDSSAAHLYAAHLAVRAGDLEGAGRLADTALKRQPDSEDTAVFRVRIFISQKDLPAARVFYESFLKSHPRASSVRLSYARFLIDQKQWEKAFDQFRRLLADTPDDADATYAAGLLALQTNHIAEAEHYLKRTLELRPENDQARLYLGQAAEQEKRYDDAIKWYREIDSSDSYFESQTRLAIVFARQGDVEAARNQLRAIQPDGDQQHVQRVLTEEQILRDAKRHQDALEVLNQAITALPNEKDLLYARALVADKLGLIEVAESDLRTILKTDPKNANALNALGYTLADRTTRYQEALELLQQAVALKPDDPFVLDSLGWVQYRLGNHAEAIKSLRRALEFRNDAEIAAHLGEVLWVTGQRNEAESVWNRALRVAPDSEALLDVIKKFKQ
ncbi:MAG TPA: tetratricopeptide repeat protein [Burkholderiales bacterium]|nr:tetratricopeptide repeat protein [Burkholderiales bacterium]